MNNYNNVYMLTNQNADGCGTDVTVYIALHVLLTLEQERTLRCALIDARHTAAENEWQQEEMVEAALQAFTAQSGLQATICEPTSDVAGEIFF